jgi:protein with PEP-CTERM/exosortase system signal
VCELLGFPVVSLGPAVISRIGTKSGDYYENTYPRSDSLLFDVHLTQTLIRKNQSRAHCSPFALMAWTPLQTRADRIAFSVRSGNGLLAFEDETNGYEFIVNRTLTVTNLGLFDFGNDGLAQSHAVTIWTSTGTQLVQATIPAGIGGILIGGFRYVSIAPFLLVPGTYTIGGFYGAGPDRFLDDASFRNAIEVLYNGNKTAAGFTFPRLRQGRNGFFGPNFQFIHVSIPDSGSTVSLLGFGLLGLAVLRHKLRC